MLTKTIENLTNQLVSTLIPTKCQFCRASYQHRYRYHYQPPQHDEYRSDTACPQCLADLPWLAISCDQCALPLPADALGIDHDIDLSIDLSIDIGLDTDIDTDINDTPTNAIPSDYHKPIRCGACLNKPPAFTRTIAAFDYQPPIARLIKRYKHRADMGAGRFLAEQLGHHLKLHYQDNDWPDQLTAVPLHWRRQLSRGFNQAAYLCRRLSKQLDIPILDCCRRIQATDKQQQLKRRQRLNNLRNCFKVITKVENQHIALIDDVMTTGTTARELSAILLAAGARRVDIWVVARTPPPDT